MIAIAKGRGKARALCLISGGLDSLLAVKVLQEQGVEVSGLSFESPFFDAHNARRGAEQLKIELKVARIGDEIMKLLRCPPHGFGKQMNPCIDCHALMVRRAGEMMAKENFDFIATGEVLGERPMSQNRQSLDTVARDSGFEGLLLRPLSAKLLAPTKPEIMGLVDREKLLAIEGRSRKPQIALAEKFGIREYVQPAGGCLLTDPAFSARLRELLDHEPSANERDAILLKLGRHFRLGSGAKAIVGRDKEDNERIMAAAGEEDILVICDNTPGPAVLIVHTDAENDIKTAALLCASFSNSSAFEVDMAIRRMGREGRIKAKPVARNEFDGMRIG